MKRLFIATLIMGVAFLASCSSTDTDNPLTTPTLTTNAESLSFSALGKARPIIITSNVDWEITPTEGGLTFTPSSGKGNATVMVKMAANETDKELKNSFKIASTAPLKTIAVIQAAKGQPSLGVSTEDLYFAVGQLSQTMSIYSDGDWEIKNATGTAKVTPAKGKGNAIVTVEVQTNTTTYEPIIMTFYVEAGTKELKVTVTQTALPEDNIIITTKGTLQDLFDARPALKTEPKLKIMGKMNDADFETLKSATSGTLTSLDIAGVDTTMLPLNALQGYSVLTSAILPTELTAIGDNALRDCIALESLIVPSKVIAIGNNAFRNCAAMKSIILSSALIDIGNDALRDCKSLESIAIPNKVVKLLNNTFTGCTALEKVTIPSSLSVIGSGTFKDCTSLMSATMPYKVIILADSTFYNCSSLTSITLPSAMTTIEDNALNGCSALESIALPAVITINDNAFNGCSLLASITLPSSLLELGANAFQACTSLKSINIPYKITTINDFTFAQCSSMATVTIPSNSALTDIGANAFKDCKLLMDITIPVKVTSIGESAFQNSMLLTVTCMNTVPPTLGANAFADILTYKKLKVPAARVAAYKASPEWAAAFGAENIISI